MGKVATGLAVGLFVLAFIGAGTAQAQVILQDFEDGTIENWGVGSSGTPPTNQTTGGPLGAGDNFMQYTSDGGGPDGRMVVFNTTEWTGDFTALGQTTVYFHAVNLGANPLTLRIWLEDGLASGAADAVSTTGQSLPADGQWRLFSFDISAGALTGADPATLLTQVARMRIIHANNTTVPPTTVVATLGLDNISNQPLTAICGDNVTNGGDTCDGLDVNGQDCTDFGFVGPDTLTCNAACDGYDTSACAAVCGNDVQETGETCDDAGDSATCDFDCTAVSCGDGHCNTAASETVASCAVDCGILQDFEDGSEENWNAGGGSEAPPANQPDNGPLGAGDNYLRYVSDNMGADGKMVVLNTDEWTGDFTARGQTSVYFHAINMGATPLTLRIWLEDGLSQGAEDAVTTDGQVLPADGRWHLFEFDVSAGALTANDAATLLTQVARMRIMHAANTTVPPDNIPATLGLDNISNMELAAICGDNVINGSDTCDGVDVGSQDCTDYGYVEAAGLLCNGTCDDYDTSGCTAECGNETAEPGEACDEGQEDTADCDDDCSAVSCGDDHCNSAVEDADNCADDCETECGDGLVTGDEVCDGDNLDGQDCTDFDFTLEAGLLCADDCLSFNTGACMDDDPDAGPDAGSNPGSDAGDTDPTEDDGGCGCQSSQGAGTWLPWLLVALLLTRRRRGQRRR